MQIITNVAGIRDYMDGYMYAMEQKRQLEEDKKQEASCFLQQKLIGAGILAFTVLSVPILDGDASIALITVPIGLSLIFSRKMLLDNDDYTEIKERKERICQKRY